MPRESAGCGARRREGRVPFQVARRSLRTLWASPSGPALSARISSVHRLDRRPVCLRRWPCDLRADRAGDVYAEWVRAPSAYKKKLEDVVSLLLILVLLLLLRCQVVQAVDVFHLEDLLHGIGIALSRR